MTKTEIVEAIAKSNDLPKAKVAEIVESFLAATKEAVRSGQDVVIRDFGTFRKKHRPERMGINPATKEPLKHAARDYASFKVSKNFLG